MHWIKPTFTAIILLLVYGCATNEQFHSGTPTVALTQAEQLQSLLAKAQTAKSPDREALQIQASLLMIDQQQYQQANRLLNRINSAELPQITKANYDIAQATLALKQNQIQDVFNWLEQPEVALSKDSNILAQSSLIKTQAFLKNNEYHGAIDEVEIIPSNASEAQKKQAYQLLWSALQQVDTGTLNHLNESASTQLKGWIDLEFIFRNSNDPSLQLAQYKKWQKIWPKHPANKYSPDTVALLNDTLNNSNQPQHIALLLPQTGPLKIAGKAIENGFMAAYFKARQQGASVPDISVYDSNTNNPITHLINQATQQGAQLIIGPLSRSKVKQLSLVHAQSVPILALNYLPEKLTSASTSPTYQFGLASEDEARQIANTAWQQGYRQAGLLMPDNSKGKQLAQAFNNEWLSLGGSITGQEYYSQRRDFKNLVGKLLHVNNRSSHSKLNLKDASKAAKHRANIDFIFMHASPTNARLLKPILSYHLAGDIPVFATSAVYDPNLSNRQSQDLNGIHFLLSPWDINSSPLKLSIKQAWPNSQSTTESQLYALGADAWMLYPYLGTLNDTNKLPGYTGILTLAPNLQIHRSLSWMWFKGGQAQPWEPSIDYTNPIRN